MKKILPWKQKNSHSENTEDQILADFNNLSQETSPIIPTSEQKEPEPPAINELGQNITALYECLQKLTALQTSHQQLSEQVEQFGTQINTIATKIEGVNTKFATLTDCETNLNAVFTSQFRQLKSELERLPNHPEPTAASIHTEIEEVKNTIRENTPASWHPWINNLFALIMMIAVPLASFLGVVAEKRKQDQEQIKKNLDDWLAKAEQGINQSRK